MLIGGKHVFYEKPLAIVPDDALAIIETARRHDRYLGVCFQNRMNPAARIEAKRLLDSKKYGEIRSAMGLVAWDRHGTYYTGSDWRGRYATEGGGCIIN
ncbi:MAG: hypothetical protein A2Z99_19665 [Treponema sp. GWB1_62_6]|nr:MAG: hypothetical protein A2Y36_12115 [Treponema sp. GWA1_62_8]OHE65881.1 MAG: hypothetical protein A2001_12125 [Treponema sp. GWC1_61_84]OHE68785.1 MAG: hypothetical protein A2413_09290 [Treponema sp. RIFOXYC1_FULL_61_9]OHE72262.1 MAG: hypothetical protein A2Z99_19665 [Treponema sp. GWB1_62_6]